jgi:hypothetical protein
LGDESQISGPYDAKGCEKKREFNPRWYKIVFDKRLVYGVYCLMPLSTIFYLLIRTGHGLDPSKKKAIDYRKS